MRVMERRLLVVALASLAFIARAGDVIDIGPVLEPIRAKHEQPAMAAAVVRGGEIIARGAVGLRRRSTESAPVQIDDRFHIGSCTKAFTSTLVAMFIEEGKLDWSTTIVDILPELKGVIHPAYEAVTLEMLLTHRAGVMAFTRNGPTESQVAGRLEGTPAEQRRAFIERLLKQPPLHDIGTKYEYSNAGYAVAAAILERLTGQSWEDLIRERIFKPLDMNQSGFGLPGSRERQETPDQPWGHFAMSNGLAPIAPDPRVNLPPVLQPGGDIHAPIEDFARFVALHLKGLRGEDTKLLKAATITRLHQPVLNDYAMGWFSSEQFGTPGTAHNGSAGMFFAWMWVFPKDDLAIVVCSNAGTGEQAGLEAVTKLREHVLKD